MISQAVILCGGKGTRLSDRYRYQPILEVPKCLAEVGGKPFVTYSINMLKGIGISDIVLLVGYLKENFSPLESAGVRLVETQPDVDKAVLSISHLEDSFILLNGDCFPVMDWRDFVRSDWPQVAVKIVGRDAGIATVSKQDVEEGLVNCSRISDMIPRYSTYTILGGLHIGTYQGLQRARMFMDMVVFGE